MRVSGLEEAGKNNNNNNKNAAETVFNWKMDYLGIQF